MSPFTGLSWALGGALERAKGQRPRPWTRSPHRLAEPSACGCDPGLGGHDVCKLGWESLLPPTDTVSKGVGEIVPQFLLGIKDQVMFTPLDISQFPSVTVLGSVGQLACDGAWQVLHGTWEGLTSSPPTLSCACGG